MDMQTVKERYTAPECRVEEIAVEGGIAFSTGQNGITNMDTEMLPEE